MTYKALAYFEDLQDNRHPYQVGDVFPRPGFEPSAERIAELAGSANKRGKAVIAAVEQEAEKASEPEPEFMNKPVEVEPEIVVPAEDAKPKRGRKRKAEK